MSKEEEARESCQGQIHHRGRGEAKGKEHGVEKWADIQGETPLSPGNCAQGQGSRSEENCDPAEPSPSSLPAAVMDSVSTSSLEKGGFIPP